MKHSVQELNDIAKEARRVTMKCIASLGKGHVGGALDIVDALTVLYYEEMNIDPANPKMAGRDRLVLSKGHGGPGLYAILALKGFFDMKEIYTLNKASLAEALVDHVAGLDRPHAKLIVETFFELPRSGPVRRRRHGAR